MALTRPYPTATLRLAIQNESITLVLAIAGGIVIAFFVIRFLLTWEHNSQVEAVDQMYARAEAKLAEEKRLAQIAERLRETNPTLYAEASARVPRRPKEDPGEGRTYAVDTRTKKIEIVQTSELAERPHLRELKGYTMMYEITFEAQQICKERGLPPLT